MNRHYITLCIAVVTIALSTLAANAQEPTTLSAAASQGVKALFPKKAANYRTNDKGVPQKKWNQQVVYRALNGTFVYQHQNQATIRHDEVSSPAVLWHITNGEKKPGHVYQNRGN